MPVTPETFREAMSLWAASVAICASRDGDAVIATTATSFTPVAASPPTVLVSLSPNAQVLPFVEPGGPVGISVLAEDQARWAAVFADSFPVASPEWGGRAAPVLHGSCIGLECTVRAIHVADGGARIAVCRVEGIHLAEEKGREGERPLLHRLRRYTRLAEE